MRVAHAIGGDARRAAPGVASLSPIEVPELSTMSRARLRPMLMAGAEALECCRVLKKGGLNLVGEVLREQGAFYEYNHYPADDVYDPDSHAQYYYHAHRGVDGEHGHFHTFIREPALIVKKRSRGRPLPDCGDGGAITHFVAISMDAYGWPVGLFATNRWVTGEAWLPARDMIAMLDHFSIDHAFPSWPVNRWISAMFILFRPHIEALLRHRDQVIEHWARLHPGTDVFEDRRLEVTGCLPISMEEQVKAVRAAAGAKDLA